ncbi:MAG: hypothetical protein WCV99_14965 [Sterolibacterium sp.]
MAFVLFGGSRAAIIGPRGAMGRQDGRYTGAWGPQFLGNLEMHQTAYCYHCGVHHPVEEMRQIMTKGGKRMRCIKSIQAAKAEQARRDSFGRQMTEANKAANQAKMRILNSL